MSTIMSPSPTLSELDIELPSLRCCHCGRPPAPGRERSTKRCQTCFLVNYCSPKCQRAHNDLHMSVCRPADDYSYSAVWGVRFQDVKFESYHDLETKPCMSTPQTRGWVCPATELIGLPIYIAPAGTVQYTASKDLQSVCHYLMMDPDTGFAMDSWTSDARHKEINYCAFHNGKHPLTAQTFETVVAFLKMIVEHVSGLDPMRGWAPMRAFMTPQAFQLFSRVYWQEQVNDGREGWEELTEPLL